jgi:hypothetical protein
MEQEGRKNNFCNGEEGRKKRDKKEEGEGRKEKKEGGRRYPWLASTSFIFKDKLTLMGPRRRASKYNFCVSRIAEGRAGTNWSVVWYLTRE